MSVAKITISLDKQLRDRMVQTRLAQECAKLEPAEEQALAEEGFAAEARLWPPY